MGGIVTAEDALEFILCGASAVAVGTGNFTNPRSTMDILEGIRSYLSSNNEKSVEGLTGSLNC